MLGASGYTGSELVRLLLRHPRVEIALLTADRRAGQEMRAVFPQFSPFKLPKLVSIEGIDWKKAALDLVFCALPHATTQKVIKRSAGKAPKTKVVDLSADFRLHDIAAYAQVVRPRASRAGAAARGGLWPGRDLPRRDQEGAAGRQSRLLHDLRAACADAAAKAKAIEPDDIVIDAKSGMTGAGRAAKEEMLFSEVSEGFHAYGVGHHRHMAELDQEFSLGRRPRGDRELHAASGADEPRHPLDHLCAGSRGQSAEELHAILLKYYAKEPFVHVLPFGADAADPACARLQHDLHRRRQGPRPGRAIVVSALDNLVKGASGQAVQNMNLMLGYPETIGLEQVALFP